MINVRGPCPTSGQGCKSSDCRGGAQRHDAISAIRHERHDPAVRCDAGDARPNEKNRLLIVARFANALITTIRTTSIRTHAGRLGPLAAAQMVVWYLPFASLSRPQSVSGFLVSLIRSADRGAPRFVARPSIRSLNNKHTSTTVRLSMANAAIR